MKLQIPPLTVEPILFIVAFGQATQQAPFIELFKDALCRSTLHLDNCTSLNETSSNVLRRQWASYDATSNLLRTLPAVGVSLLGGAWSDSRHGSRKALILLVIFGQLLCGSIALSSALMRTASPLPLLLASLAIGMTGGFATLHTAIFAQMADERRMRDGGAMSRGPGSTRMSATIGAEFIGSTLGLFAGAYIVQIVSPLATFFLYILTSLSMLLYTWRCIFDVQRTSAAAAPLNIINFLAGSFRVAIRRSSGDNASSWRRSRLALAFAALGVYGLVLSGERTIFQPFAEFAPLHWSLTDCMLLQSWLSIPSSLTPLLFVPIMRERFAWRDTSIGALGALSALISGEATALSKRSWQLVGAQALCSLRTAWYVSLWGIIARSVEADEQARIYALVSAAEVLGPAAGGYVYAGVFQATEAFWPGAAYCLSTLLGTVGLALFFGLELLERRADCGGSE